MGINMKKTVMLFLVAALTVSLFGCAKQAADTADTQPPQQEDDYQPRQTTEPKNIFTSEADDDYVRYTGGGISILLEGGFTPTTAEQGNIVYSNRFLTVSLTATDDYDAQMLEASGFQMADLTEEDYGSILIDANNLDKDALFYDYYDNLCMTYTGENSDGTTYEAYSVIKKDTATNIFWLIQFLGTPAVYEPYSVYFPEWAASVEFTH